MSFENVKEYLDSQYTFVTGKEKNYYCDEEDKIVATVNNEMITLYIDDPKDELETQYQKCVVSIPNCATTEQLEIKKLVGAYNDTTLNEEGIITLMYNDELDRISSIINTNKDSQRNLGSIGNINIINGQVSFSINKPTIKKSKITRKPIMIKRPKGLKRKYS